MIPAIFALLRELGPRYGFRRCRFTREPFFAALPVDRSLPALRRANWLNWAVFGRWPCRKPGRSPRPPPIWGCWRPAVPRAAAQPATCATPGQDIVEIGMHLGLADDPPRVRHAMSPRSFAFVNAPDCREELDLLRHAGVAALLRETGAELVSFVALDGGA